MSDWASVADVQAVYESEVPARTQALLDRAETLLKNLVPAIADRITAGTLDPELVRMVLVDATMRVLRNPRGFTSEHEGDYGYTYSFAKAETQHGYFTAEELALLRATTATGWATVGTIQLGDPYKRAARRYEPEEPVTWVDDPLHLSWPYPGVRDPA